MTDDALRACIADAGRDVTEAALRPGVTCYEIAFAVNTLHRLTHELRVRCADVPEPASEDDAMMLA